MNKKNFGKKLMNWHKIFLIAFFFILISAILPPTNVFHVLSAIVGFGLMVYGCAVSLKQGITGDKVRAGAEDGSRAYIFAIFLTVAIAMVYGHFFEFSILDYDIFSWLK